MKFSIVARFSGIPDHPYDADVGWVERECVRHLPDGATDVTEQGDCEFAYLADECADDRWRTQAYDVTVSTVVERVTFDDWCRALYLRARDEQTMGTLGGPLGPFVVPDIVFSLDEPQIIDSIRVTPIPTGSAGEPIPDMARISENARPQAAERVWSRLRAAVLSIYGEGL